MNKLSAIASVICLPLVLCNCSNNEEDEKKFSIIPFIEFKSITFVEVDDLLGQDSLNLGLYFTDGDMNLGLNQNEIDIPYQPLNFFVEENGSINEIPASYEYPSETSRGINRIGSIKSSGKLVTIRTRAKSGFDFLPEYEPTCQSDYYRDTILINEDSKGIIDEAFNIVDTIHGSSQDVYVLKDTLFYEINEKHFNVLVDFLVRDSNGSFKVFDFRKEICVGADYNGRFPQIAGLKKGARIFAGPFTITGISSYKGILNYSMLGSGFKKTFEKKTLKLRIKIYDRELNESNVIETPEFTLDSI